MNIHPGVVGIDVSKHHLDVFDAKLGRSERLANTPAALVPKLAAWRESEAFVLFEATGSYDRALARMLVAAGIAFARVNPGWARDFARAAGFLAKTDAVDARMLAAMAQCLRPKAQAAADPQREAMATLHKRRSARRRAPAGEDPQARMPGRGHRSRPRGPSRLPRPGHRPHHTAHQDPHRLLADARAGRKPPHLGPGRRPDHRSHLAGAHARAREWHPQKHRCPRWPRSLQHRFRGLSRHKVRARRP